MDNPVKKLFLVGNPNVGKSVIFGALTGAYATVSNYPGTTVALARGKATIENQSYQVIDAPGVNSLLPMSEDERVTRDLLLENEGVVIQIADAKNLLRALPLTFQLQEMETPLLLVVNMCDEAARAGIQIDFRKLEELLGIPVVETVAIRGEGIPILKKRLKEVRPGTGIPKNGSAFARAKQMIEKNLPSDLAGKSFFAEMLLAGDRQISARLGLKLGTEAKAAIEEECRQSAAQFAEPVGFLMGRERRAAAAAILNRVSASQNKRSLLGEKLGAFTMHPVFGWVVLAAVLEGVYLFVGKFGAGTAVDFIETNIFEKFISPSAIWLLDHILPAQFIFKILRDCLVGPYGLITMGLSYGFAIVLPIVTTFFIAFSVMEDSGYLPRLAIMVNRFFKWMGLNGKAVLPMVLGLGCDTMATLTTRILETRKQRLIVILLLALAVPCSAQLGILLGMFGTMPAWTFWVWLGVVLGVIFFVGFASSKIIAGESAAFLMEIPPLRVPRLGNVAKKTMARLEWYVKEAIPLFLLGTFILFILDAVHLLGWIQKGAAPLVVSILGLPEQASNAFLIGFLRRDYGATGFFDMYSHGQLTVLQALVALVVITLFVPCIANVFMMVKEAGGKIAARMVLFIFPFAFLVGGVLNWVLR